jgi:hypothetical protein
MAANARKKSGGKLGEYERKRDLATTPEPAAKRGAGDRLLPARSA